MPWKKQRFEKSKFILEQDLIPFLQKLEVYDDILAGEAKCMVTGEVITIDNLEALVPCDGKICFLSTNGKYADIEDSERNNHE